MDTTPAPLRMRDLDAEARAVAEGLFSDGLDRAVSAVIGVARGARDWLFCRAAGGPLRDYQHPRPDLADRDALAVAAEIRARCQKLREQVDALERQAQAIEDAVFTIEDSRRSAGVTP